MTPHEILTAARELAATGAEAGGALYMTGATYRQAYNDAHWALVQATGTHNMPAFSARPRSEVLAAFDAALFSLTPEVP